VPEIAFVMSAGQDWHLRELAETLAFELARQDVPSAVHQSGFPAPREGLVQLLLDPDGFVRLEGEGALPDAATLARTIFLSTARPGPVSEERATLLRRAGAVFDIHPRGVLHLRRAGVPGRLLKPGYSEHLDRFDAAAPRPIDVMFIAGESRRRSELLARLAPTLARFNCLLSIAPTARRHRAGSSSHLGPAKWDLLTASKVVLNLHHGQERSFEWWRAMDAIHAGAVVVSEPSAGLAPLVAGEHLLVADPDALPFVLESILGDPERLGAIRQAAYERASQWMPLAMGIGVLRAAAVELVGAPLTLPGVESPSGGDGKPEADPVEIAVEQARHELGAAREELAEARSELEQAERRVASRLAATARRPQWLDSAAWPARSSPRASVLLALTGPAAATRETLAALERQRESAVELVVVDAGAEEAALEAVSTWIRARPRVPARLLVPSPAEAAPAARELAFAQARGRYCLILDPGTVLYPRALEVLIGTLDGLPEVGAAYPMVQLAGSGDGGPVLCNCFGWEPEMADDPALPVLVRRTAVQKAGRLSDALGLQGQLVPQILAARTDPEPALR
jgi:hypothetical protein